MADDKKTPLFDEHVRLNALMAPFAGYCMPIHYGSIIEETKITRTGCSIFDISHMGEIIVKENPENCSLDMAITVPVTKIKEGSCKYGFLLNENGTVIDDLIVYRIKSDEWMIVVNASNESRDYETIKSRLSSSAFIENISAGVAKFDVQGPKAYDVMKKIAGTGLAELKYFTFKKFPLLGEDRIISRTGYTGELGFEVYLDNKNALAFWNEAIKNGAAPAGLGSRDILRSEAGLPLYGDELTEEITPVEAGMEKFIDFEKEFTGKAALVKQKDGGVEKKLCGFKIDGRRTPRHSSSIVKNGSAIGTVSSGVFSPHLNCGIGMGYVKPQSAEIGTVFEIDLGRGTASATVVQMPFLKSESIRMKL
ncbi:MAG TPA: glycine cleavage system aminomethyltransferase GcvT [Candidatus Goldiibacteriota bacterium]|nr:glycine cleavage system aminomethyltransferase GcvT [Candidatus Goldiibacteriota bacterium]HPN64411.1 glycine cleavage system aminomethyltransferase GcvT [Candidatus Goldiibacteriota bacterium]HRQ42830.1 glycine cleavage system aminomethyltransferase GcvT [Candidatus Goldiibacteriota bacterium]